MLLVLLMLAAILDAGLGAGQEGLATRLQDDGGSLAGGGAGVRAGSGTPFAGMRGVEPPQAWMALTIVFALGGAYLLGAGIAAAAGRPR